MKTVYELWCKICDDSPLSEVHLILEFPNGQIVIHKYRVVGPDNKLEFAVLPCAGVPDDYMSIAMLLEGDVRPAHDICIGFEFQDEIKSPRDWVKAIVNTITDENLVAGWSASVVKLGAVMPLGTGDC